MIMTRNDDGTYSQVGFIKDVSGADIEYIKDKNGVILFEKGFSREKSGALPLQIEGIGKPLKDYTIYGNTYQAEGVSPDNPQEVVGSGDRTANLLKLKEDYTTDVRGVSVSTKNGALTLKGTATAGGGRHIYLSENITLPSGTYSVKGDYVSGLSYHIATVSDNVSFNTSQTTSYTFTLTEETEVALGINVVSGKTYDATVYVMLNEGETALPYEPYGYKIPFTTTAEDGSESITTTAYLDNPIHKIGDYADVLSYSGKSVERVIKELILTGEENITHHKTFSGYVSCRIPIIGYVLQNSQLFCTHSQQISFQNLFNGTKIGIAVHNTQDLNYVILAVDGLNSKEDYKNWLAEQYAAGTPVKVHYVLAAPVTETVELPEIPTLDGTTVIDVDTAVQPSEMQIKYKSKI